MDINKDAINSPNYIMNQSMTFLTMGVDYAENVIFTGDFESEEGIHKLLPKIPYSAVNISFSLELAIKGLLKINNIESKIHDLHKLFNLLPKPYRVEIAKSMEENFEYRNMRLFVVQNGGSSFPVDYLDLYKLPMDKRIDKCLEYNRITFVEFRYFYEPKKDDLYFDFPMMCNISMYANKLLLELLTSKIN